MTRQDLVNMYKTDRSIKDSFKLNDDENYLINKLYEAISVTCCCDKLKDLKDDNFDGYTIVDIKGGQIILHKGDIYTPEFIDDYNKMK